MVDGQAAILVNHNSQEACTQKRVPVEFNLKERRADSRPRAMAPAASSGQRFHAMRQRLYQAQQLSDLKRESNKKQQVNVLNNDNRLNSSVALETTSNEINESLVSP